jgi:hypothetical protein
MEDEKMEKQSPEKLADILFEQLSYKKKKLPENFALEMASKFRAVSTQKRTGSIFMKTGFAAAAVIIIFAAGFFAGTTFNENNDIEEYFEHSVIASAEVMTGETVTIKLVYDSENDVDDVDFSITLPEGLAFNSDNPEILNTKTINWSGSLKKGRNEIPFVVKAVEAGLWHIDATAEFIDGLLTHEIAVRASNPQGGENV